MSNFAGIVLAAGEGRRMGRPKALLTLPSGATYLESACLVLSDAGCAPVIAVLGAEADIATNDLRRAGLTDGAGATVDAVINPDWPLGMSTSLRVGLSHLQEVRGIDAAVIHLVDLPGIGEDAVKRLVHHAAVQGDDLRGALARASYAGAPGHPVLIGRDHWPEVLESLEGDAGARGYFRTHSSVLVEVGDLATGRDVDTPEDRLKFEAE